MNKVKQFLRSMKAIVAFCWEEDKWLLIAYFGTSLLGALLLFVVYYVYKLMIDSVTNLQIDGSSEILFAVVISYLFFEYVSRFVNFTFNQYFLDYFIRTKLQNILTRRFMEKIGRMDFAHLENGDVRNLIAKVENTYAFRIPEVLNKINAVVYNVAALFFSFLIALQFDILYFLILGLISVPVYYLRAKYGNIAFSSFSSNAPKSNYLWYIKSMFTDFRNLSEMKIYGLRGHFVHKAKVLQDQIVKDYEKPMIRYSILSTASFILVPVAIFFALNRFIGGIVNDTYSIGDFTFFLNTLFTFSGQISSLLINFGSIMENNYYVTDYYRLLSIQNSITVPHPPYLFSQIEPRQIRFENVSFSYPGSENLSLHNVSFTIEKGENVALVGHNGAGKSSLIKLLFRFYDPKEGRILVDGQDLRTIDIDHWYAHLGVLFQDFARYYLSLRENIQFGNITLDSEDQMEYSLQLAQGAELLNSLPRGYKQFIGRWFEGGVEVSGGQWQKIAIARAIYRNAPILIMDEPTSAIDADAEKEIFENLERLYREKSLIFISHRFSTVRTADKIIVLEKGRLVEEGTHDQLICQNGLYHQFYSLQQEGYQ